MAVDVYSLASGDYKVVQLLEYDDKYHLFWGSVERPFSALIIKIFAEHRTLAANIGKEPQLKGDSYSIVGMGFCNVISAHSSKKHFVQMRFSGGSDIHQSIINYDHLKKWTKWLENHDSRTMAKLGMPYRNALAGPTMGYTIPLILYRYKQVEHIRKTKFPVYFFSD